MIDIPCYDAFTKIDPIAKGWSGDKKYCVETADGLRMLLRLSDISEFDRKSAEYGMMERAHGLGVLTPQPLGFGLCDDGKCCYSLSGWLDGEDAEKKLPLMSETEQYNLGLKSGGLLRKLHLIPAPCGIEHWSVRFNRRLQYWIDKYNAKADIHSETVEMAIRYLKENCSLLDNRPQSFIHGDFNTVNIIVMPDGIVKTIDFNGYNHTTYGDPWWDMENFAWMPTMFPHFHTGQIHGYFNGSPSHGLEPPIEFWNVLTYYLVYDTLTASTDPQDLNDIEDGAKIVNNILE